jgi:uroporphyrinogen decarboxylase
VKIKPIRPKWRGTMTDRERFNNQMHYKPFDRSFNMEFGYWDENFRTWPMFIENGITNNGQADVFFSFDIIRSVSTKWIHPPFEYKVISETADKRIIQSGLGQIAEVPKDGHDTIPHFLKSAIATPDDWKKVKEERFDPRHPDRKIDIGKLKARFPDNRDFPVGVDCGSMIGRVRDLLTLEGLAYAVYDYPEMVEDMVETCCVLIEDFLDQVLPAVKFDFASGWEDIAAKNGPLVSMDFFRNVVVPRYKRINAKLKAYGIDIWYTDCDGDVRPLLPYFLESGINCLFPFEVNCGGHPGRLLDEYGKDLRIMGGIDKMELAKGPEAIKAYLKSVERLVARGGYIPFCDHRCPPDVSQENYLYYLDLKEKMFGMQ